MALQVLTLCPGCPQCLHRRTAHFGVGGAVALAAGSSAVWSSNSGAFSGSGHARSSVPSRQNSLISLKRYHCLLLERPGGVTVGGSSVALGAQVFSYHFKHATV